MGWKYNFGQILGIIVGVTAGMGIVNYAFQSLRASGGLAEQKPLPAQTAPQKMSILDEVVADVQESPKVV